MDTTYRTHDAVPGTVRVSGAFRPNGNSALVDNDARNTLHGIATITRNGVGLYTVSLPFSVKRIRSVTVGFRLSAIPANVANLFVVSTAVSSSTVTIQMQYTQNNVAFDIADNAANWVDWAVVLDNETVP